MKSWSVTIQMKDNEQYVPVVLFIMLYKVVLNIDSVDKCDYWNKSSWPVLFLVVLSIILYKMAFNFESVDEIILKCNLQYHSNESYWAVLSCGAIYYAVQGGSCFWVCRWNPNLRPFKWRLLSSTSLWWPLLCKRRWLLLLSLWMKNFNNSEVFQTYW